MTHRMTWFVVGVCVCLPAAMRADTLVMRDGRRVDGEVIGIRDGIIEFDGRRGGFFGGRERIRVERADVQRIEFDEARPATRDEPGPGGRPSGLREREVTVNASTARGDTGIDVRSGQTLYFSASGRVRWGPSRQDGPAGEHNSPRNANRPIPGRPAAALIGRIGESGDWFFIGDDAAAIRMRSSGRLYLGINDDFLQDNSGSFRVTVYY